MGRFAVLGAMVRKDLLRQVRSPLAMLIILAFPLLFAGLLALVFGGGTPKIQVRLLVEDRDQSLLSGLLLGAMSNDQVAEFFDVREVGSEGLQMIRDDEASALLRIPEQFGEHVLDGTPVTLELVRNPSQSILPEIAEQALTVVADGLDAALRILREPLNEMAPLLESDDGDVSADQVARVSVAFYEAAESVERYVFPPVMTLESVQLAGDEAPRRSGSMAFIFVAVLPGIAVWALFMVGDLAMRDIVVESSSGTLTRQLCGPVRAGQVVVAKALFTAVLSGISLVLLSAIGAVAFRGTLSLAGFGLLSLAVILAVTGLSASIYGLARSERQGATVGSILLMLFAFLGGSFFEIDSLPGSVRQLAPISPFYWGTTGYAELIRDGGSLTDVLLHTAVLAAIGLAGLSLGATLLQRKFRRGEPA